MVMEYEELQELLAEASSVLRKKIRLANAEGNLEEYLRRIELQEVLPDRKRATSPFRKTGTIIVIGDSKVKDDHLLAVAKKMGIAKERFELHTRYADLQKFEYCKLRYNMRYVLVLFGPAPHNVKAKYKMSSIISEFEKKEGYPETRRLHVNGTLKITKENFRGALDQALKEGLI